MGVFVCALCIFSGGTIIDPNRVLRRLICRVVRAKRCVFHVVFVFVGGVREFRMV